MKIFSLDQKSNILIKKCADQKRIATFEYLRGYKSREGRNYVFHFNFAR